MKDFISKIKRMWVRLRLQPIRVFCFHQVSEVFDPESMWECDWISKDDFKTRMNELQKEYTFISLLEAYDKLKHDAIRCKKFAVLTADDGYESVQNIVPWLFEQKIPLTLFISPALMNGMRKMNKEMNFLSQDEIFSLQMQFHGMITLGNHGNKHLDCLTVPFEDFVADVRESKDIIQSYPDNIPFFAYPYGHHTEHSDLLLYEMGLMPVYCDGKMNYNNPSVIHREILK